MFTFYSLDILQVEFSAENKKLGIIHTHPKAYTFSGPNPDNCFIITLGEGLATDVAKGLFASLRGIVYRFFSHFQSWMLKELI